MVTKFLKCLVVGGIELIAIVLLFSYMPNIPPYAKYSESYSVTPALPLEGKLALNEKLNDAEILFKGDIQGPEAFAEYNGELYTTVHGGDVVKITGNHITPVVRFGRPCKGIYQEHICGRPLGLRFDKNGALFVADAYYGIYKVDIKTGKYVQLISIDEVIGGKKPKLPNSLVLASNGDIYWTDSSSEFALHDGLFDVLADGSGRLIHYDIKTKKNTVLIDNIYFANGIGLSKDESFLIVSESSRSRILRYYLKGPKKGTSDVFLDGIPGMPDNIQSDGQGGFLLPLVMTKDSSNPQITQVLGPFPLLRKFISRIFGVTELGFKVIDQYYPSDWAEKAVHFIGHFHSIWGVLPTPKRTTVLRVNEAGEIIESLHALDKKFATISDAFIFKDGLYLGSPANDYLVRVSLNKAGLKHLIAVKPDAPKVSPTTTTKPTTKPDVKPADTKPADTKPVDRKPADSKPTDTKPADTKPVDRKPADSKPADRKPTDTKPKTSTEIPPPKETSPKITPPKESPPKNVPKETPPKATPPKTTPTQTATSSPTTDSPKKKASAEESKTPPPTKAPTTPTSTEIPPKTSTSSRTKAPSTTTTSSTKEKPSVANDGKTETRQPEGKRNKESNEKK